MHTEIYCLSLDNLDRAKAIRAIHEALLQLSALSANVDCQHYDNMPAIESLVACMKDAGHMGYTPDA